MSRNVMYMHPLRQGKYRVETANDSMPSVTAYSWTCRTCGERRHGTAGRKKLAGEGWKCAHCVGGDK